MTSLGEPSAVLTLGNMPDATPGPGQVLVKVLAAANFSDVLMCRGLYQVKPDPPFTPGVELCGEIVELGDGVDGLTVGDRVLGASTAGAEPRLDL